MFRPIGREVGVRNQIRTNRVHKYAYGVLGFLLAVYAIKSLVKGEYFRALASALGIVSCTLFIIDSILKDVQVPGGE